jgi:hypothetical protein
MPLPRSYWRLGAVAVAAVALGIPAYLAWETSHAVRHARERTESEASVRVDIRPLTRAVPAGVEPVGGPAVFRDAALFRGHLFVAGPQGLGEYDASGALVQRLRTGLELPPAPLVCLTVGVLAGTSSQPALLIGTDGEGLITFDGKRLTHVRPERPELRKVTAMLMLASGRLLIGTDAHGLLAFDGQTLSVAHPELGDVAVTTLAGTDGDVWIGTRDRGLCHWRAAGVDRIDETNGLPDRRVLSLATRGTRAYAGTALGVAEFADGRYTRTLGAGLFASAIAVRQDTLFVGTMDETIAEIPLEARPSRGVRPMTREAPSAIQRFIDTAPATAAPATAAAATASAAAPGRTGVDETAASAGNGMSTFYALAADGLYAIDGRDAGLRRVLDADRAQLTDRNISALAVDGAGRLWVGYFDRGLDILAPSGERLAHVENDHVFCVNRIVHDADGGPTAVATANGLVLFDAAGRQQQVLGRAQGLIADHVTDVTTHAGRMTIATPAGLTFIDRDGSRSLSTFHGLVNNHVYAIGAAGTEVFAGTLGGASVLDNGVIHATYTSANSALTHNWITAVARVDDEWFIGTYGGGMFHLDAKETWHRFPDLPVAVAAAGAGADRAASSLEINPNAIVVTDASVFVGTLAQGMLAYNRQTRRWTTVQAGLPSLNVTALAADSHSIIVGTDNGIVRLDLSGASRP